MEKRSKRRSVDKQRDKKGRRNKTEEVWKLDNKLKL